MKPGMNIMTEDNAAQFLHLPVESNGFLAQHTSP
jgi:hypothetical protein